MEKLGSTNAPPAGSEDGNQASHAAASAKPPTPSSSGEAKENLPDIKRTKINITSASGSQSPAEANPFAQLGVGPTGGSSPAAGTNLKTKRSSPDPDVNRPPAPSVPPAKRHAPESVEDWSDKIISQIFRVTLNENRQTDLHGRKLTFLPGLAAELQEQDSGAPLRLSSDNVEQAILEAASSYPQEKPLMDYMLACWKRVVQAKKSLRAPTPEKEAVIQEVKRLSMSYSIFAVTLPDLFRYASSESTEISVLTFVNSREPNPKHDSLVPYLLRDIEHESGICLEFIQEAVARISDDDSVVELFVKAMVDISTQLSTMSMNDDYRSHVNVSFSDRTCRLRRHGA